MRGSNGRPVIILGAGGHAKVVAEALLQAGVNIVGYVDPGMPSGSECFGIRVLGDDSVLSSFAADDIVLVNGIGSMPGEQSRFEVASRMREKGFSFSKVIHPSAVIGGDVVLEEGVQVMAGVVIQPGTHVGQDTIINTGALIDHDCRIGSNCHIAPGVTLSGGVLVDVGAHLGTGATVIQNISIGKNSLVAAGSVVYKDLGRDVKYIQPDSKSGIYGM
ncbi:MAG: acetyltransferase [Gammaproteobacteria bacterium]|nr:acetyltransferase [Gammaproteobacteria bacterium]